jgi:hypothetical protein
VWEAGYFNDRDRSFHTLFGRHLDELIPALVSGSGPPVPASAGHRALQLADAAVRSFESGLRVEVG